MLQTGAISTNNISDFAREVHEGLSAEQKYIPSKYLYDASGDELFSRIMFLPEYYLSRCETEILSRYKADLSAKVTGDRHPVSVVELGAGDASKTKILLHHLHGQGQLKDYIPVDISAHVLSTAKEQLSAGLPGISVKPLCMEYEEALVFLRENATQKKLVLFLGSSIGNYSRRGATEFLTALSTGMNEQDHLLVGFDLRKDPSLICRAYNDKEGVTREFNMNLLRRINRELGGNFRTEDFIHYPVFDPGSGEMKSFLLSTRKQVVHLESNGHSYAFEPWESIFTEVSMKYSETELKQMFLLAGLADECWYSDKNHFYVNVLLRKKTNSWKLTALK